MAAAAEAEAAEATAAAAAEAALPTVRVRVRPPGLQLSAPSPASSVCFRVITVFSPASDSAAEPKAQMDLAPSSVVREWPEVLELDRAVLAAVNALPTVGR